MSFTPRSLVAVGLSVFVAFSLAGCDAKPGVAMSHGGVNVSPDEASRLVADVRTYMGGQQATYGQAAATVYMTKQIAPELEKNPAVPTREDMFDEIKSNVEEAKKQDPSLPIAVPKQGDISPEFLDFRRLLEASQTDPAISAKLDELGSAGNPVFNPRYTMFVSDQSGSVMPNPEVVPWMMTPTL